ncbi:Centriolin [Gossypium arboreum]|uniref:Centriolin n=1 Tax=Gossypium arboreum TaxID=29729 RepID=A0A0B0N8X6_GOSAR|nr:Centriolin [Gossypium arboreum]
MAARSGGSSFVQPLHPPSPKSPPKYPDLYGKRRERAKVQMLEREISFLEEELKSIEGFQPASRYCKEVTDFVMANSDPLIQLGLPCFNMACTSCCPRATACPANAAPHLIAMHVNALRATAALVTAVHVLAAAKFQNGSVAAERCRAVANFDPLHAQTAVLASGNAIVLNVQSYAIASVVQKPVVTHVANCSKMSFNFLQGIN